MKTPDEITRWETFGGSWRITEVNNERAKVDLLRCDGSEVVETLESREPHFVHWAAVKQAAAQE